MIVATASVVGAITTEITQLSGSQKLVVTVDSFTTASIPALQIKTEEAQLRGPRGADGSSELPTDPLAYYILATG